MALVKSRLQAALVTGAATLVPLTALPAVSVADTEAAAAAPAVVASGLDNPRQLSFKKGRGLFIAEAGTGGEGPCFEAPEGGETCFGLTGAITRVRAGDQTRVVRRLPSRAQEGAFAIGPADVVATPRGRVAFTVGLEGDPRERASLPRRGRLMATLLSAKIRNGAQQGRLRVISDLGRFELRRNPHKVAVDTDPTGVLRSGKRFVVTDAGGNDLLRVGGNTRARVISVFGNRSFEGSPPFEAVPTSVVRGPDGALYVSQLTGFPFPVGAARIYRIRPGLPRTVYASGLTNVTDLGWHRGSLYAVQFADAGLLGGPPIGSLRKVVPGGTDHPVVVGDLQTPYGVAFRRSKAYMTVCSVCPDAGQVVSVPLG